MYLYIKIDLIVQSLAAETLAVETFQGKLSPLYKALRTVLVNISENQPLSFALFFRVEHDNTGFGPGWYLQKVRTIQSMHLSPFRLNFEKKFEL